MGAEVVPALVRLARVWSRDVLTLAEDAVLVVAPQGGQAGSRRNAWAAMAGEARLAAARREGQEALRLAWARAGAPGGSASSVPTGTAAALAAAPSVAVAVRVGPGPVAAAASPGD